MTRKRCLALLGVFLVLVGFFCVQWFRGYTISFFGLPHFSLPPNQSSVEVAGLRMTIKTAIWEENEVHLRYAFEWDEQGSDESPFVFMRPFGHLYVAFWDADGNEIKSVSTLNGH